MSTVNEIDMRQTLSIFEYFYREFTATAHLHLPDIQQTQTRIQEMSVEATMEDITERIKNTDERMDDLALQVGNIEGEIFAEDGAVIEVNALLKSVGEMRTNYQNLRKDLVEVQDLQKQLSSTLQEQLRAMQAKCSLLKEKVGVVRRADNTPPPSNR